MALVFLYATYRGPSATKGSRITVRTAEHGRRGQSVPYDHGLSLTANMRAAAEQLCATRGLTLPDLGPSVDGHRLTPKTFVFHARSEP